MNFDLEQALDFAQSQYCKRQQKIYEDKRKKRRFHYEEAPVDNRLPQFSHELLNIVSSFALAIDSNTKLTTNIENNRLSEEFFDKNLVNEENLDDINRTENSNINDNEMINSSCDNLESSQNFSINNENSLHYYTNISTEEFCSMLLTLLRESNTCESHANRLLSFINSILPTPNTGV
ncbi:unnamed protein product [Rotaria sordida]|uniref:Uncharacterized protein n=1 Tax=Rotaria sordida TaxID=392033 RepID=A0A814JTW5_9BILA|nr:unnamed protein product [Rotaria sordida]CAF3666619.1 unnamed protein product [Rotaria sordida]